MRRIIFWVVFAKTTQHQPKPSLMLKTFSLSLLTSAFSITGWAQSQADTAGPSPAQLDIAAVHIQSRSPVRAILSQYAPPQVLPSDTPAHTPFLLISGSADVYYRYDFARTDKNVYTSFTHSQDQFQLGMASVRLEHKTDRLDMVADIGVGPRAREYAYNDKGVAQAIKQLYISYAPSEWLKFTAGTWCTHLGYEVVDAFANRNYSMSYLFTNGPFSHTGVKADFTSGKSGLMIGVVNPNDYRSIPSEGHNNKNMVAQYSYSPNDNLKLYVNYVGGRDCEDNRMHQYDLTLTARTGDLFSFGFNSSLNRSSQAIEKYTVSRTWWGSALYLNLDPKPWLGLTLRTEYFNDEQGVRLPSSSSIVATTFSLNLKADGFTLIPEFRFDNATAPIFFRRDGSPTHSAANVLLAAIYSF